MQHQNPCLLACSRQPQELSQRGGIRGHTYCQHPQIQHLRVLQSGRARQVTGEKNRIGHRRDRHNRTHHRWRSELHRPGRTRLSRDFDLGSRAIGQSESGPAQKMSQLKVR